MDSKIQNIEIDLNLFLIEKNGMVSRIDFYQRFQTRDIGDSKARGVLDHLKDTIKKVLEMLVELTDNINALMKYFEIMNVTINEMITEHDT